VEASLSLVRCLRIADCASILHGSALAELAVHE
jgi:hypothetical protein